MSNPRVKHPPVVYCVDPDNRLCEFNEEWDRFALANDSAAQLAEQLTGTNLLAHISDQTLCHLTQQLIDRVRQEGVTIRLPMRCDSPDTIREMAIELSPAGDGKVRFSVELLGTHTREPVALLDPGAKRADAIVSVCSWCKRMAHAGAWKVLEEAIRALSLFEREPVPRVSHGLCPDCRDRLMAAL